MKSKYPKVLCEVLFRPMISWVTGSVREAGVDDLCVVVGRGAQAVRAVLPEGAAVAEQAERRGTGHAVMMARDYIRQGGFEDVLVLYGDAPFVSPQDIKASYRRHKEQGNALTLFSAVLEEPTGYGRILRGQNGVAAIVEEADADDATKRIQEINAGTYWFKTEALLDCLDRMDCNNTQGEYYLTDTVELAVQAGMRVDAYQADGDTILGANDRGALAKLNELARLRELERHRAAGVDIPFGDGVVIGAGVTIGPDTQILPGTILKGNTTVGQDCVIGPNSYLDNATLGDGCIIHSSCIDSSVLEDHVKIGPMSNVRPNCHVASGVKVGDFVELKNSTVGERTSVAHLTYIGDSDVGGRCNFGCGVVTVNYDGSKKHRTTIGDGVFIGCNTNLIAPVSMGNGSYSAAGTTVTRDVPEDSLVIGRAQQTVKEGWAKDRGLFRK